MSHISMSAHADAPIERCFALLVDFKRYLEWNVMMREVLEVTGPGDQVGTKFHSVGQVLGRRMDSWSEIVEADPPRMLRMVGQGPDNSGTIAFRVTPAGTGTDVAIEVDYEMPAGIFGEIADKLFVERFFERGLRHSAENFTALVERKTVPG